MRTYTNFKSPFGNLFLLADNNKLIGLYMNKQLADEAKNINTDILAEAKRQLQEYFSGSRQKFDLPLYTEGTEFQKSVWKELQKIPYGKTISYGELAKRIGNKLASRAVGMANNRNPISIIIPCHRVIGANGSLTGYGGGLECKQKLLDLEKQFVNLC